jgi:type 1 glutamine amidotransferase
MKYKTYFLAISILFMILVQAFAQPDNRIRQPHSRNQFQVLLYTSADRWHNITEPTAILEFQEMADRHAFGLTVTQLVSQFNDEALSKFDVVVFLHSTSRDFSPEQLESLKKFIRNGGGFVGIHGTSACANEGEWFRKLVGRTLTNHPEEQTAVMTVLDKNHPATMHLPDHWVWTDEWYSYSEALTKNQQVLITLDESTYDPNRCWGDTTRKTAMGKFHPIAWYQEYDGGRSFYTTLGHMPALYKDAKFLDHIYGGIYWAATGLGLYK